MEGFLNLRLRPWVRRLITRSIAVVPAAITAILYCESGTAQLLVFSQVILSLQLSFAVFPLVAFTSDVRKMGPFVNPLWLKVLAYLVAVAAVALDREDRDLARPDARLDLLGGRVPRIDQQDLGHAAFVHRAGAQRPDVVAAGGQVADLFGALADQVVGNYGAPTVKVLGRTVHVMGASDAKAEMVLRGMTVAGVLVDEVTTIPEQFFTQLLGRMSVAGAKLFGTTNPDSPAHWLKRKFLDRIGRGEHRGEEAADDERSHRRSSQGHISRSRSGLAMSRLL